jgi:hypothetical protein
MLHDAILSGVVRDDGKGPPGRQALSQRGERALERSDLVVYSDTHRLKEARELGRPRPGAEGASDSTYEVVARREGLARSPANDLARKPSGARFIGVLPEHGREVLYVRPIQQIRSGVASRLHRSDSSGLGTSASSHTHVEWRAFTKSESTLGRVDLM